VKKFKILDKDGKFLRFVTGEDPDWARLKVLKGLPDDTKVEEFDPETDQIRTYLPDKPMGSMITKRMKIQNIEERVEKLLSALDQEFSKPAGYFKDKLK